MQMDFYSRVKSFLGLPSSVGGHSVYDDRSASPEGKKGNIIEHPPEHNPDEYERFGFNIFSSPLEMHRYFEHEMNAIIKSFGMFHNDDSFFGSGGESFFGKFDEPFFGDNTFHYDSSQFPKVEDYHKENDQQSGSLRDQYLKPGYEQPKAEDQVKTDVDIDGRFDMGDLDNVLKGTKRTELQPRTFVFGQSITSKTIRNADGTVETRRTVTDQHGNQEITVTHSQGSKEYTKTTRTDKNGHEEVIENLVNLDEKDKDAFLENIKPYDKSTENLLPNWFPFDKFFK